MPNNLNGTVFLILTQFKILLSKFLAACCLEKLHKKLIRKQQISAKLCLSINRWVPKFLQSYNSKNEKFTKFIDILIEHL